MQLPQRGLGAARAAVGAARRLLLGQNLRRFLLPRTDVGQTGKQGLCHREPSCTGAQLQQVRAQLPVCSRHVLLLGSLSDGALNRCFFGLCFALGLLCPCSVALSPCATWAGGAQSIPCLLGPGWVPTGVVLGGSDPVCSRSHGIPLPG